LYFFFAEEGAKKKYQKETPKKQFRTLRSATGDLPLDPANF